MKKQTVTSKCTSINSTKLPRVFSVVEFKKGTCNLDFGGGRFDNVAEKMIKKGVVNVVYDPFWRTEEHNQAALAGVYDTATISNVLNVIDSLDARIECIQQAFDRVKAGGSLYITVYVGDKTGVIKYGEDSCQLNRKLKDYVCEVQQALGDRALITCKKGVLTAVKVA